jgi:hypothetical protein
LDGDGSTEKRCACGNEKNAFLTSHHQRKNIFLSSFFFPIHSIAASLPLLPAVRVSTEQF